MELNVILHPTDGSEHSDKALDFACDLAAARRARLIVLHVQKHIGGDQIPEYLAEYAEAENVRASEVELLRGVAENVVGRAEDTARSRGVPQIDTLVVEGDPAHRIVETARDRKVDAIVMGSRGLGDLQGLLLGSVSHKVAHLAPCSCVIVR